MQPPRHVEHEVLANVVLEEVNVVHAVHVEVVAVVAHLEGDTPTKMVLYTLCNDG